jgi:hypothetical protein
MPTFTYTAEEAMNDGILFDVSDMGKEAGFLYKVRITTGVYELVTPNKIAKQYGQSFDGRLWDVLYMAALNIKKTKTDDHIISFQVTFQNGLNLSQTVELWAALDTTSGPAIHILLPSEY